MTNTTTTSTFRVQVASFHPTGQRAWGCIVKVDAANKQDAARIAEEKMTAKDAEQMSIFNATADRLGTPRRTALFSWKAETVRRFASDNR